jgi:hypothetical protein
VSLLPRGWLRLAARCCCWQACWGCASKSVLPPSRLSLAYENLERWADQAYRFFIGDSLDITHQKELPLVMLGRTDQLNGQALRFNLETRCMGNSGGCWVDVQDSRQIRLGWPEQAFSEAEQKERMRSALQQAGTLVQFSEIQEKPEGWQLIAAPVYLRAPGAQTPEWVAVYNAKRSPNLTPLYRHGTLTALYYEQLKFLFQVPEHRTLE